MSALLHRIQIDPKIMLGKPVIRGTRITVEHVMSELAAGMSTAELLNEYPHLKEDDVRAACAYAAAALADESIDFLAAE